MHLFHPLSCILKLSLFKNETSRYASNSLANHYLRGKIAYLSKCWAKVMDDLSCAVDVFEYLDVKIDTDNEEDAYAYDSVHYNSDCTSDSDCDEIE